MRALNKLSYFGRPMIVALLLMSACAAQLGATTIYQTGFEAPAFTTGPLSGQNGWFIDGPADLTLVENTVAYQGSQAVSVAASSTTLVVGAHDVPVTISIGSVLTISDYANFSATGSGNYWTPVSAYFANGRPINVNVNQTGQLIFSVDGSNTDTGVYVSAGTWNQYTMAFNYSNDTVTAYLNGSEIEAPQSFSPNDADLSFTAFYVQPNPAAATSQIGYFDNLSVTVIAPEPNTSFYILGAGILLFVAGRVRSKVV